MSTVLDRQLWTSAGRRQPCQDAPALRLRCGLDRVRVVTAGGIILASAPTLAAAQYLRSAIDRSDSLWLACIEWAA
jgi:hypothetical protein